MKSIQIEDELHKRITEFHKKSGMSIKAIAEIAIDWYLKHVRIEPGD